MHKSLNANFLATFHCPLAHSPFATVHQTVWPNMLFQGGFEAAKPVVGEVIRAAHTHIALVRQNSSEQNYLKMES